MKYLRSKVNGQVFHWNEVLAKNPNVETLTEEQAFPERFAPVDYTKREIRVDLSVDEAIANPPPVVAPELAAERGTLFRDAGPAPKIKKTSPKPAPISDVLGLVGEI